MFARGLRDEGLQRLRRDWLTQELQASGEKVYPSECIPQSEQHAFLDGLAEVNNIICATYEYGQIQDALEKLHLLDHRIHCAPLSSFDDDVHRCHAIILRNLAHIYFVKESFEEALSFSRQAVVEYVKKDDDEFSASLWFNVGLLTWQMEKSAKDAQEALNRSLEILTKLRSNHFPPTPASVDRDIVSVQALLLLIHEQLEGRPRVNNVSLLRMLMARRTSSGYEHESVCNTLCGLGSLYMKQRDFGIAVNFLREAYRLQQSLKMSETDMFRTLTLLGQCLQPLGQSVEAMSCFRESLRLKGKTIMREGPQIQAVFATALYNIGMIQSCQGDRNDQQRRMRALHSFKLCLDLRRKALGSHNPSCASALHNIGILLLEDGQVAQSMQCFQESLQIRRQAFGSKHHEVASSLRHIGKISQDRGEYHDSLRLHLEALWILRQSSADVSEHLIEVLMGLGQAQHINGLLDQALKSYEEASDIIRKRLDKGQHNASKQMVRVLNIMGGLALDMVDSDAANKFFTEAAKLSGRNHVVINNAPPCASAA